MAKLSNLDIKLNLRPIDLDILYKFVPESVKESALPKNPTIDGLRRSVEVLVATLLKRRTKKTSQLRAQMKPGAWVYVRWGKKPGLGKTFLAAIREAPTSDHVAIFTSKGLAHVPLHWCGRVFSYEELEPVKEWAPGPKLPENHPLNTDSFLDTAYRTGFYEPLRKDPKDIALALSTWDHLQRELEQKVKRLNDDEVAAVFHAVQEKRLEKEKDRILRSHIDQVKNGSWILIKPDLSSQSYEVVLLDQLHEEKELLVWYPDEDSLDKVPEHWFQKILVHKGRVRIGPDGQVSEQDKIEHSKPYRLLKLKDSTNQTRNTLLDKSLRESTSLLRDWISLWTSQKSNLHKLVRERGQALLDWFGRWTDPAAPNKASVTTLQYDAAQPLKVLLVLSYHQDKEHLADFVRAEVDLFEGTVRSKDKTLQKVIESLVK